MGCKTSGIIFETRRVGLPHNVTLVKIKWDLTWDPLTPSAEENGLLIMNSWKHYYEITCIDWPFYAYLLYTGTLVSESSQSTTHLFYLPFVLIDILLDYLLMVNLVYIICLTEKLTGYFVKSLLL